MLLVDVLGREIGDFGMKEDAGRERLQKRNAGFWGRGGC